ncbi:MAG: leucyl aminopeptidase [Actinomycetaceae bacterium]|nr:leucyl aminopeptidase [Arcanobacterium sp.]MDD7505409.1 leucyl aminopeptidase [Actinomycetaceae bacterium]MDY6143546.1 leucyl aminopeptidase [Arcanobacterium sp.]
MTQLSTSSSLDTTLPLIACGVIARDGGEVALAYSDDLRELASDPGFFDAVTASLNSVNASAQQGALTQIPAPNGAKARLLAVGLGEDATCDALREAAGVVARAASGEELLTIAFPVASSAQLEAVGEGALLGAYEFTSYKKSPKDAVSNITIVCRHIPEAEAIVERCTIVAESVNRVRDLVNTPASDLHPDTLAQIALDEAQAVGCSVKVWDLDALKADSINGIVAVGAGAYAEPRLVRVEWNPQDAQGFTALVGKGITFDSGGYSIKPASSMVEMKTDMGGAATILETVIAVARLDLPTRVVAWMCCAENMVSGTAQRPDDVIRYRNGITVEVNNTDAEGRLVLADGLICAVEEQPDAVIDIATLTGAQMVALGNRTTGIMGSPDLREAVTLAADAAGEPAWPMPLPQHLRSSLDSDIAEMKNSGTRDGGMLVAGLFLEEFVGDTPWAHIDIAGPSFNRESAYGYMPKGATGVMVRTLVQYFETLIQD